MIIKFEPIFFPKIWGGHKLKDIYQVDLENIGEVWGISAHQNGSNVISNGLFKGMTLSELFQTNIDLFGYYDGKEFPLLIKVIDAAEDLSIQVHPDDVYAQKNENANGKNECWYILDVDEKAKILIGHNAKSKSELKHFILNNDYSFLRNCDIAVGDSLYIPAGTIHSIYGNTLLLEVQQSSDVTYRFYDYNRLLNGIPRELHLQKALDVVNIPDKNHHTMNLDFPFKCNISQGSQKRTASIHGDYIFIIEGNGIFGDLFVQRGDFLMVPSLEEYEVKGTLTFHVTTF
ncbi:MAG: mannose-6-phosphate isomerase [Bacilli bacterium]|nr:mannose-6-phosphate isomerase [Bacilli bacterium]